MRKMWYSWVLKTVDRWVCRIATKSGLNFDSALACAVQNPLTFDQMLPSVLWWSSFGLETCEALPQAWLVVKRIRAETSRVERSKTTIQYTCIIPNPTALTRTTAAWQCWRGVSTGDDRYSSTDVVSGFADRETLRTNYQLSSLLSP